MAGSIIVKPAVQQRFDSFIQRGRVLFVGAPCGFGKSTLADALPEAWDILLIDDFQQIPEGSEEQTLCQLKLSGVSVKQDGTLIYNGEEQTAAVIKAATAYGENEVKFTFSAEENGNYAATVPAFTNAGSYTVYYKAEANNHETASGSFTVTIEKAIVTVIALDKTAYVRRKAPDLSNPVKDKDYTVTYGENKNAGKSAGTVTITAKGNYDFAQIVKMFDITAQIIQVTAENKSSRVGYDLVELTYTCAPALIGTDAGQLRVQGCCGRQGDQDLW